MDAEQIETLRREDEARTWAMVAHLAGVANVIFPFCGLIGAILVYTSRRHDSPIIVDNARNAINMQLTLTAFNLAGFALFVWDFFASDPVFSRTPESTSHFFASMIGTFGLSLINLVVVVFACFAARAAYLGHVFRYPIAIPFLRSLPRPVI